jgi:hypothetical protein
MVARSPAPFLNKENMRSHFFEDYEAIIYEDGTIVNRRGKKLKHSSCRLGYLRVGLTGKNGKRYNLAVHRLLAIAFIPNPLALPEVNHKNGIKGDFSLGNLEWITHRDNIRHARETGLFKRKTGAPEKLKRNRAISLLRSTGEFTVDDLAVIFGISQPRVIEICK